MFKTNEYFDGKVKSISFQSDRGPATVGAMSEGEYVFGTTTKEYMTIISGSMEVLVPGQADWLVFTDGQTFSIEQDVKFKVRVRKDVAYLCIYE
ncbi:MAG: pyrimidine/purine nucleoside phosphorylase [Bacteroidetes bacterium]|nr:pyrimidine/purine nucleoside phosphorylase [Bacteroidota bacterium]MBU1719179.1 pyrimidine/purine nucleoside phosphorylase [Bacteroidota bacterium]